MKCIEIEKQIDSLLDGELSLFYKKQVENHLDGCNSCRQHLDKLQAVSGLLKNNLPVSPSDRLDARVMEAFRQRQNNQPQDTRPARLWSVIFGQLIIPNPVFALTLLVFAVLTGLAFQLGRITAPNNQSPLSSTTETADKLENSSSFDENTQTKIVEVPVTKFIKVPVFKEKVVTRIIYKTERVKNDVINKDLPGSLNNFAQNSSTNKNDFLTPINLKVYQPVSELKIKIIKKGETNE